MLRIVQHHEELPAIGLIANSPMNVLLNNYQVRAHREMVCWSLMAGCMLFGERVTEIIPVFLVQRRSSEEGRCCRTDLPSSSLCGNVRSHMAHKMADAIVESYARQQDITKRTLYNSGAVHVNYQYPGANLYMPSFKQMESRMGRA